MPTSTPALVSRRSCTSDGYPAYLPGDVRRFVASHAAYAAWVAEGGGELVGHVALHNRARRSWPLAHEATRTTDGALAVVARLLVSPTAATPRGVWDSPMFGPPLLGAAWLP
jgi:hypothetical protein